MLSVRITKRVGAGESAQAGFTLDVAFEAPAGVTILFGASGSGKTTTLKSIAGITRPDHGNISIDDQVLFDSEKRIDIPIRQRRVGYLFQNLALFPHKTALANVEFGMANTARGERRDRALKMMAALRIEHTAGRKPRDISGGEAQRVALARALTYRPRILLLDEPLSAIDEATKLGIIADLKAINRELLLPIIYVTHSREEAIAIGERVIVYEAGRVVGSGEPVKVFGSPVRSSVARLTGVENIFSGRVVSKSEAGGMMTVEITDPNGSCLLDVPFGNEAEGERVSIAVPSGDILLALDEPRSTSARNILRGEVAGIEDKAGGAIVLVRSGVSWRVKVTRQSVRDLGLESGQSVWLAIKTHACYLLDKF
ncbi:MAG TPA: molybdenum ABC transporter ATP-binding protein [Blastocatellia bacterium]|nr:molybdenum ABC transporter ATP-binding protein [Blastocatellia bacterium]